MSNQDGTYSSVLSSSRTSRKRKPRSDQVQMAKPPPKKILKKKTNGALAKSILDGSFFANGGTLTKDMLAKEFDTDPDPHSEDEGEDSTVMSPEKDIEMFKLYGGLAHGNPRQLLDRKTPEAADNHRQNGSSSRSPQRHGRKSVQKVPSPWRQQRNYSSSIPTPPDVLLKALPDEPLIHEFAKIAYSMYGESNYRPAVQGAPFEALEKLRNCQIYHDLLAPNPPDSPVSTAESANTTRHYRSWLPEFDELRRMRGDMNVI